MLFSAYSEAFAAGRASEPFLTTYAPATDKRSLVAHRLTRGEFLAQAQRAAGLLRSLGLRAGDCHTHYFTANTAVDLVLRLASVMIGTVPVTINWDADTPERAVYKVAATASRVVLTDEGAPAGALEQIAAETQATVLDAAAAINGFEGAPLAQEDYHSSTDEEAARIIIFTSGTTGLPKGVLLPHRAYRTNRATFETFLSVAPEGAAGDFAAVLANPLHHTNSTAISDWCLRRPGAQLHMLHRYTTQYWALLVAVSAGGGTPTAEAIATRAAAGCRVVCPLVSRHVDFLDALASAGELPVAPALLRGATSAASPAGVELTTLLLGSAPVGPSTVERLVAHCGTLPTVRFGSTETCLQVMGTPLVTRTAAADLAALRRPFERGWAHEWRGVPATGYFIGRSHPPHTEVRVVRSAEISAAAYLDECTEGEPGQLVTRGANLMTAYVGDAAATAEALDAAGWYLKLGDVGFYLVADDGGHDHYWLSRDSALLIRGGANYAYEQINNELTTWAATHYGTAEVEVSVVGLRVESEHEDACLATVEFRGSAVGRMPATDGEAEAAAAAFTAAARAVVSKGAKPDRARFAAIPKNFKGAVLVPDLVSAWKEVI